MRIFDDENGVMNKSVLDIDGDILVVSQFTLHASTKKGNRPSYIRAAKPDIAIPLYVEFCERLIYTFGKPIKQESSAPICKCILSMTGPVTILIDSKQKE